MIVFSKALSPTEISGAKLMQAGDKLDTQFLQQRQHEPAAIVPIRKHKVARFQLIK